MYKGYVKDGNKYIEKYIEKYLESATRAVDYFEYYMERGYEVIVTKEDDTILLKAKDGNIVLGNRNTKILKKEF